MRLGEIYERCNKCYNEIKEDIISLAEMCKDINGKYALNAYRKGLNIKCIKILSNCEDIREIDGFKNIFMKIDEVMNNDNPKEKSEILVQLKFGLECVLDLFNSMGIIENKLGLDIKMPPTDNITDFRKYVDELEFIFTKCPFFYSDKESLKLKSVDIGSIWLVIGVAGAATATATASKLLNNIAAFIDKCYVIKSHKQTCEQQKMVIEKAKADQKQKEEMIAAVEKIYQFALNDEIRQLEEATKIKIKDNEERDRMNQSFDRLEKLLDKGLQIYSAIDSPEEIKAVFAPVEMHYLTKNDNISQIEEKSDKQSGEQ